jgi:hypothetical protein
VEDLIVGLLAAVFEIFGEFLLEVSFELAAEALSALINRRREHSTTFSAFGLVIIGVAAGLISALLIPHRLIATRVVLPGASLLLAPIVTGCAMYFLGNWLRRVERLPSNLATFRGGVLFAFSMAIVRWWLVGLPH